MLYKKKWTLKHFGKIKENKVGTQIGISPEISQILKNRDIITEKDAEIFMNPSLDYLRDPFLMKDMQKGVGIEFGIAEIAITETIFKIFAPKILPTQISWCFFLTAVIDETNSGSEVPSAITVKLIIPCGIPIKLAISTPLSTNNLEPIIIIINPHKNDTVIFKPDISFCCVIQ